MDYSAQAILDRLLSMPPRPTAETPRHSRGIYGLHDHQGAMRYIGSTSSTTQSLHERIHQRHRTGSEELSHYFSHMYNTGRMWRDRFDRSSSNDAVHAKALRNAFVAEHCRAVWVEVPDQLDIAGLERELLGMAPSYAIAWNNKAMAAYDEPTDLVDRTLAGLGWDRRRIAALDRQRQRHGERRASAPVAPATESTASRIPPFPSGPFRFFALDVETANSNRTSVCQIGVAAVRADGSVATWVTYVDPHTDNFAFSMIHGITLKTVQGAPSFVDVLPVLTKALGTSVVYQHSGFDRGAINAACGHDDLLLPPWTWRDSVAVARKAWPELRGNGGHGLASLKRHLDLKFRHHDAGEDARAAAEVVLRAEALTPRPEAGGPAMGSTAPAQQTPIFPSPTQDRIMRHIGTSEITLGNIRNSHIYMRDFFHRFPAEVIGGSNAADAGARQIVVEWGGSAPVSTDLDGEKKFFRKRAWIRQFFELHRVVAGSVVSVDQISEYHYRLSISRR